MGWMDGLFHSVNEWNNIGEITSKIVRVKIDRLEIHLRRDCVFFVCTERIEFFSRDFARRYETEQNNGSREWRELIFFFCCGLLFLFCRKKGMNRCFQLGHGIKKKTHNKETCKGCWRNETKSCLKNVRFVVFSHRFFRFVRYFFFFFEIVIFTNNSILFAKLVGEVHRIEFSDNSIFLDIITEKKKKGKKLKNR